MICETRQWQIAVDCLLLDEYLVFIIEHNLVAIDAVLSSVSLSSRRVGIRNTRHRAHCVKT